MILLVSTLTCQKKNKKGKEKTGFFSQAIPMEKDFVWLGACMQSYQNLKGYEDIIRNSTNFKSEPSKKNKKIIAQMQAQNSVAIHVRRGDYVSNKYTLLSPSWYEKAIRYIKRYVKNPVYYIFSDDINWAKQNLKIDGPHIFITWNTKGESYNDLRLMTFCKHNIIANSTFSWWGAFLGKQQNKIVIMPDKWIPWEPGWEKDWSPVGLFCRRNSQYNRINRCFTQCVVK